MIGETIELLRFINPPGYGVRDIARNLHHRPNSVIKNLKRMKEQGLITFQLKISNVKGRPKKIPKITDLGIEYLESFNEMQSKILKARKADFDKALKDLKLTERMINRGRKPDELFVALRDVVFSIKGTK